MKAVVSLAFAFAMFSNAFAKDCIWSECEGMDISGKDVCDEYGSQYFYIGNTWDNNCDWNSERLECCRPTPWGECKWSHCMHNSYGPVSACREAFDDTWVPSGSTIMEDCRSNRRKVHCCQ